MKKTEKQQKDQKHQKKKLVLRKESIRALDSKDLSVVVGGIGDLHYGAPPDGGVPPQNC